jgi:hypothetical protein
MNEIRIKLTEMFGFEAIGPAPWANTFSTMVSDEFTYYGFLDYEEI